MVFVKDLLLLKLLFCRKMRENVGHPDGSMMYDLLTIHVNQKDLKREFFVTLI